MISTPHISAPEGAFAKTVLMPGDPLRAKFIAETFLENAQLVTSVRNMLGYTGTYKGVPVSVMGSVTGMAETAKPDGAKGNGKYLENGQVVIHKDGQRYNAEGTFK